MKFDLLPDGEKRVLIEGDAEELDGLAETIRDAVEHGQAEGAMLDSEGVETVIVQRVQ